MAHASASHAAAPAHTAPNPTPAAQIPIPPEARALLNWLGLSEGDIRSATSEQIAGYVGQVIYRILPTKFLRSVKSLPKVVTTIFGGVITLLFNFLSPATGWGKTLDAWVRDIVGSLTILVEEGGDATLLNLPKGWEEKKMPSAGKLFAKLAKLANKDARKLNAGLKVLDPDQSFQLLKFFVEIPEDEMQASLQGFAQNPATLQSAMSFAGIHIVDQKALALQKEKDFLEGAALGEAFANEVWKFLKVKRQSGESDLKMLGRLNTKLRTSKPRRR